MHNSEDMMCSICRS